MSVSRDNRQGARRPPASGSTSMMEVSIGAQSHVPKPRSDEELLSAPMTREFIRASPLRS
jgi:hypothetical protein